MQGRGTNLNAAMLEKLKVNSYTAAAFKQYKNNTEIVALLFDESGNRRSFAQFKAAAKPLMETFNKTHLQAEYNLAVRSAQSAAKWATYEKRGGKIKYVTVGDANVRDEHALLNGTIKPVNDVFWDNHFPPNDWGCRCGTSWVADDTPDVEPQGYPDIPPPFQNNVGKTGQIFNPKHPYFADVDKATAKELTNFATKEANKPLEADYKQIYTGKNGGSLYLHPDANPDEIPLLTKKGKILADDGHKVQIRPYYENNESIKNPDYNINGKIADLKTIETATNLIKAFNNHFRIATSQESKIVIIDISSKIVTKRDLKRAIGSNLTPNNYFKIIEELWLVDAKNKVHYISREQIKNKSYLGIIDFIYKDE